MMSHSNIRNKNALGGRNLCLALIFLSLTTAGSAALAGPVSNWNYVMNAAFTSAVFTGSASDPGLEIFDPDGDGKGYEISWGAEYDDVSSFSIQNTVYLSCSSPNCDQRQEGEFLTVSNDWLDNRSALTIGSGTDQRDENRIGGGESSGDLALDGAYGQGSNITHWNNPIWRQYRDLMRGSILIDLSLTPDGSNQSFDFDLSFSFDFVESANAGIKGVCYDGSPGGACPDLFQIAESDALSLLNNSFVYDNNRYYVSILVTDGNGGASPIGHLADGECGLRASGPQDGCRGWRTAEEEATTVQFAVSITTTPVPSPAPIALLALGFVAMGFARQASVRI
ncbi:hypothetical protein Thiowin_04224 [Thiorhodovibrio winogradskyi]|uniref:PEP-CTERM protein-sorting domain-containing protein n=2 Tax=Thiorhodovibrio winogradskyi TaxID=77007 RepID=A0ABZ0SDL7_9GAMM